ncbi:MAG: minor capsid protein, partial [Bacillota bacterium]
DALKYLTNNELKEFKRDVWWYIEKARDKDYRTDNKAYLQALSVRARVRRLEALGANILMESEKLYNELESSSKAMFEKVYEQTYYKTAFDTFQGVGFGVDLSKVNKRAVQSLLEYPWNGKNYSDNIWDKQKDLAGELNKVITRGMIQGQSVQEMSRALRDAHLGKDYDRGKKGGQLYNATRVVRTETNYIANQASKDMYSDLGMKRYEYCATLDSRTSEICADLNGQVFDTEDAKPGVNYPPMHPHCRSTTVPYFEDLGGTRLAKDADGKYYKVPGNMKYKDWYSSLSENEKGKMAVNTKMAKNAAADKEQHAKYKAVFGKEIIPGPFAEFQKLKYNDSTKWGELKAQKQDKLNSLDFSQMKGLVEKLSNLETRSWYYYKCNNIPNLIDKSKPIEEQAHQCHELRNKYKKEARDLMKDQAERKNLDMKKPIETFEETLVRKMDEKGITRVEAIKDIAATAPKTNKDVNKKYGLEG